MELTTLGWELTLVLTFNFRTFVHEFDRVDADKRIDAEKGAHARPEFRLSLFDSDFQSLVFDYLKPS